MILCDYCKYCWSKETSEPCNTCLSDDDKPKWELHPQYKAVENMSERICTLTEQLAKYSAGDSQVEFICNELGILCMCMKQLNEKRWDQ